MTYNDLLDRIIIKRLNWLSKTKLNQIIKAVRNESIQVLKEGETVKFPRWFTMRTRVLKGREKPVKFSDRNVVRTNISEKVKEKLNGRPLAS